MDILLIVMKIIYIYKPQHANMFFMCMFCSEKHDKIAPKVPLQKTRSYNNENGFIASQEKKRLRW